MTPPRYGALGASLYVPATHKHLGTILAEGCASARSIIICTEDAVADEEVEWCLHRLMKELRETPASVPHLRFLRPRSPALLREVLQGDERTVAALDGVVLPKFDHLSAPAWADTLALAPDLPIMPTLETAMMFQETTALQTLTALQHMANPVIALRIGANDLLGALGLKRQPGQTIYDTPLRSTLERIITLFRPAGYELSAPVCDLIGEPETLAREIVQDIAWGFYAKTCVHPTQIDVIEAHLSQALARQHTLAAALMQSDQAVFKHDGQMLEQTCHQAWASRVNGLVAP